MTRTARTLAVLGAAVATAAALLPAAGAGAAPAPEQAAPTAVAPTAVTPAANLRVRTALSASGFVNPVLVTSANEGSDRLYVVEKAGRIRWVKYGRIGGTYLDIRSLVSDSGEQGLLGLAFAPDFRASRLLWVSYTNSSGALVVARFRAATATATSVSAASRVTVLTVPHPSYQNHNGGTIAFGPDGKLYIGTGDGGGGGDPFANGQDLTSAVGQDPADRRPLRHCGLLPALGQPVRRVEQPQRAARVDARPAQPVALVVRHQRRDLDRRRRPGQVRGGHRTSRGTCRRAPISAGRAGRRDRGSTRHDARRRRRTASRSSWSATPRTPATARQGARASR